MPSTIEPPSKTAAAPTPAPPTPPAAPDLSTEQPPAPAKPSASTPEPTEEDFENFFKRFDKTADKPAETPPSKPDEKTKTTTAKAEPEKKLAKTTDKPADEKGESKTDEPPPEPVYKTNKELKAAYESAKQRNKSYEERIKELEARASLPTKPDDAFLKAHQDREAELQKRIEELQTAVERADFTKNPKFQREYQQPYVKAWERAMTSLTGMQATDADGNRLPLTKEDVETLLSLPEARANQEIQRLFGDNIGAIATFTSHRQRISDAFENLNAAKEEFKQLAADEKLASDRRQSEENELMGRLWVRGNELMATKSEWLRPNDDDPEGSELLKQGFEMADKAFNPGKVSPEERVALHVQLRNKAAAYDRLVAAIKSRDDEIMTLKAELEDYQGSSPTSKPTGKEATSTSGDLTDEAYFERKIDEAFAKS